MSAGRRLRGIHQTFRGVRKDGGRYSALEPDAYAWVHATLIASFVDGHAHFGRPMSREQVERFYQEYPGLGRLIGVRERDLPKDWAGFRAYFDGVVESELKRNEATDRVLRAVRRATPAPVPLPGVVWRAGAVLPESLRITGPAHLRRRRRAIAHGPLGDRSRRS